MATSIFNMPSRKMLERVWQIDSIGKIMTYFCLFAQGEGWGCKERRRGTAKATGVLARRSALLISRVHNLIRMQLHIDAHTHTVSRAMLCSSWTVTYPPSFPPIMHPPPLNTHTHTHHPTTSLPSLCCFVLSLWKIMKASTCNRGSIDVRIHNQQIQKHILGSK